MQTMKIALVGAGMFGGDVHLRAFADVQRAGLAGVLGRLGFDDFARPLAEVRFQLAAVATRSEGSARRAADAYAGWLGSDARPRAYHGERPWEDLLRDHPDLDVLAVATPDHLHTEPVLAALEQGGRSAAGCHVIVEKPMCLEMAEADRIVDLAREKGRVVASTRT
jgi:predicted dehydrogenase